MARYINADALIKRIQDEHKFGSLMLSNMIAEQPTVDVVERKKGEWIFNPSDAIEMMFTKPKCSECGFESADGGNFCPNCGADMRGEKKCRDKNN